DLVPVQAFDGDREADFIGDAGDVQFALAVEVKGFARGVGPLEGEFGEVVDDEPEFVLFHRFLHEVVHHVGLDLGFTVNRRDRDDVVNLGGDDVALNSGDVCLGRVELHTGSK